MPYMLGSGYLPSPSAGPRPPPPPQTQPPPPRPEIGWKVGGSRRMARWYAPPVVLRAAYACPV